MTITISSTIVVVEDDPTTGWMLSKLLELLAPAHLVATYTESEQALVYLHDYAASCVITDYRLPGMDGPTFIKRVIAQWPDTPIAIITGEKPAIVRERLVEQGLDAIPIIEKPVTLDAVHTTILPLLTGGDARTVGSLKKSH